MKINSKARKNIKYMIKKRLKKIVLLLITNLILLSCLSFMINHKSSEQNQRYFFSNILNEKLQGDQTFKYTTEASSVSYRLHVINDISCTYAVPYARNYMHLDMNSVKNKEV